MNTPEHTGILDPIEARTVQAFDKDAETHFRMDPKGTTGDDLRLVFSIVKKHNPHILDVGCGYGRMIPYLKEAGGKFQYTGIDPSKSMLEIGKREFPKTDFRKINFYELSEKLPEYHYDIAIIVTTFAYLIPTRRQDALMSLRKVLTKGAIGYFSILIDDSNTERGLQISEFNPDKTGEELYSTLYGCPLENVLTLLKNTGFRALRIFGHDETRSCVVIAMAI